MNDLSVIIPIYNEEENISTLYSRLCKVLDELALGYEVIFVNDGSKDKSFELIKELASQNKAVKYIDLSRNFGHQIAVSAGIDVALGNAIIIIDADLQDPPELIFEMYQKLKQGYQVVYAKRKRRDGDGFMKRLTSKVFYRILVRITNINIPLDTGDFRIIDKKVAEVLRDMPEQQKFLRGQISWIGFKQTFVEYERNGRLAGSTGYTYKKMISLALDGITSFSNFPLKFATFAGFGVSGFSFFMILYALYGKYISHTIEPGWTSLMMAISFIGGVQLIGIGIIGEYISRMSANIRKRPLYVVNESNISQD
jgi:glycosyltransferase involved in cell wall biosynthesis